MGLWDHIHQEGKVCQLLYSLWWWFCHTIGEFAFSATLENLSKWYSLKGIESKNSFSLPLRFAAVRVHLVASSESGAAQRDLAQTWREWTPNADPRFNSLF